MYKLILLALFLSNFGTFEAGMPEELRKILGIGEDSEDIQLSVGYLKDGLKEEPGTVFDSDFDVSKAISQSPSNMHSIKSSRKNLGAKPVETYMPTKVTATECHVEFQVSERVPGRCTLLAGNIPACQAEKYVGINYNECS